MIAKFSNLFCDNKVQYRDLNMQNHLLFLISQADDLWKAAVEFCHSHDTTTVCSQNLEPVWRDDHYPALRPPVRYVKVKRFSLSDLGDVQLPDHSDFEDLL